MTNRTYSSLLRAAVIVLFLATVLHGQSPGKWSPWEKSDCYTGISVSLVNMGFSKAAGGYLWGIRFRNDYDIPVGFSYKLEIGKEPTGQYGYDVTTMLQPGEIWTDGEDKLRAKLFKNSSSQYFYKIKAVCSDDGNCGSTCYAGCDITPRKLNRSTCSPAAKANDPNQPTQQSQPGSSGGSSTAAGSGSVRAQGVDVKKTGKFADGTEKTTKTSGSSVGGIPVENTGKFGGGVPVLKTNTPEWYRSEILKNLTANLRPTVMDTGQVCLSGTKRAVITISNVSIDMDNNGVSIKYSYRFDGGVHLGGMDLRDCSPGWQQYDGSSRLSFEQLAAHFGKTDMLGSSFKFFYSESEARGTHTNFSQGGSVQPSTPLSSYPADFYFDVGPNGRNFDDLQELVRLLLAADVPRPNAAGPALNSKLDTAPGEGVFESDNGNSISIKLVADGLIATIADAPIRFRKLTATIYIATEDDPDFNGDLYIELKNKDTLLFYVTEKGSKSMVFSKVLKRK